MAVPLYKGEFGVEQAERLLWRAGFGPRPGEAAALARKGMRSAVLSLSRPSGAAQLVGPAPRDSDGLPLSPGNAWGHDHLWWLDRMVRSDQPMVERMTLVWHDWFATGDFGQSALNLAQNALFRKRAMKPFDGMLRAVTSDPAMLVWLSGIDNSKDAPNENYGREMMELFTLGADAGYTEDDVREQARALTGWAADWVDGRGLVNFRYVPGRHDDGRKTIFGQSGRFDWEDSCRMCLEHPAHAGYLVRRLWSYFIPSDPSSGTVRELKRMYKGNAYAIRPLLEAILMHPDFYDGPRMVKPPIVQIAGMMRARRKGIDRDSWTWIADTAGQRLFLPPNVAGWDETRWLDTARLAGRWEAAIQWTNQERVDEDSYDPAEEPAEAIDTALEYWADPSITAETRSELLRFCRDVESAARADWQKQTYRALRQNALRVMIAGSPDYMTA